MRRSHPALFRQKPYRRRNGRSFTIGIIFLTRIFKRRSAILVLAVLTVLAGIGWLVFVSGIFFLRTIDIKGEEKVKAEEIRNEVIRLAEKGPFIIKQNLLFFKSAALEETLRAHFPRIKTLTVKKKLPDTLEITIEEREARGVWCNREVSCFYIDNDGVIFEEAPSIEGGLILLIEDETSGNPELGNAVLAREDLTFLIELRDTFAEHPNLPAIKRFVRRSQYELDAMSGEGNLAIMLDISHSISPERIAAIVKEIMESRVNKGEDAILEYIDLRIPGKVYYK